MKYGKQMTTYRTALSPIIAAPIVIIMMVITPTFIINKIWSGLAVNCAVFFFVLHMYLTTRYTIAKGNLTITSGFFYKKEIPISSITHIQPSNNPISSPAFSLKRLEICHGIHSSVLISPIQQERFLREIAWSNPSIHISEKSVPQQR